MVIYFIFLHLDLWPTCVDIFFHKGLTILSADDDQLQLRSILNATEGLTRKHNPRKRYGPQQDVWCSFATGAVISAHVISSLQSESDSFRYCMQTCAKAISFNVALQYGFSNIIALDRGYSGIKKTTDAADAGLRHLGGIKIYIGPFTDKPEGNKRAKVSQKYIPSCGHSNAYYASHVLNNKNKTTVISLCYRTGTGKLCHMQSSSEDTDPFEWDYEYDECKDKLPDLIGNDMRYLNFTSWERSVTLLTLEQRTPDWFCLRKFGIGGTTSESVVKTGASLIADEDWRLCDLLGTKRQQHNRSRVQ